MAPNLAATIATKRNQWFGEYRRFIHRMRSDVIHAVMRVMLLPTMVSIDHYKGVTGDERL